MFIKTISWVFWLANFLICSTLKYKVRNEPLGPVLFALWHGQTFPLFYWARHRKLCIYPTETWRGDTISYLAKKYKYQVVRFREKATPAERTGDLTHLLKIATSGHDVAIAVDGPPKPLIHHKAKPGILFLSQKSGLPIVPVGIRIKRKLIFSFRWDKYEIPLPWSEVEINFGKPFVADEKTNIQELEKLL